MGRTLTVQRTTSFSTPQLLRLVRAVEGVSTGRQLLGYYHRTGLLRPTVRKGGSGRGCGHRWGLEDATALLTIVALRKAGVPMPRIRRALAVVRQRMPEILAGGRDFLLVAHGRDVALVEGPATPRALGELLTGERGQLVWLPISHLAGEVKARVKGGRA